MFIRLVIKVNLVINSLSGLKRPNLILYEESGHIFLFIRTFIEYFILAVKLRGIRMYFQGTFLVYEEIVDTI